MDPLTERDFDGTDAAVGLNPALLAKLMDLSTSSGKKFSSGNVACVGGAGPGYGGGHVFNFPMGTPKNGGSTAKSATVLGSYTDGTPDTTANVWVRVGYMDGAGFQPMSDYTQILSPNQDIPLTVMDIPDTATSLRYEVNAVGGQVFGGMCELEIQA